MSACAIGGEAAKLLASTPLDHGSGVYCMEMTPTAAFTHVLIIYRKLLPDADGFVRAGEGYCPGGTCPAK
ncbi:MAG: hypothetical protein QM778_17170 [Myxococcales bacterium]